MLIPFCRFWIRKGARGDRSQKKTHSLERALKIKRGYDEVCRRQSSFLIKMQIFFEFRGDFLAQAGRLEDFCLGAMA